MLVKVRRSSIYPRTEFCLSVHSVKVCLWIRVLMSLILLTDIIIVIVNCLLLTDIVNCCHLLGIALCITCLFCAVISMASYVRVFTVSLLCFLLSPVHSCSQCPLWDPLLTLCFSLCALEQVVLPFQNICPALIVGVFVLFFTITNKHPVRVISILVQGRTWKGHEKEPPCDNCGQVLCRRAGQSKESRPPPGITKYWRGEETLEVPAGITALP